MPIPLVIHRTVVNVAKNAKQVKSVPRASAKSPVLRSILPVVESAFAPKKMPTTVEPATKSAIPARFAKTASVRSFAPKVPKIVRTNASIPKWIAQTVVLVEQLVIRARSVTMVSAR